MEGLSGDAAEMSAQIQALALALHLDNSIKGAAAMLKSINAQLDSLLPQLPPGFFQPILPEGSLSQPQVRHAGRVLLPGVPQNQLPAALRHCFGRLAALRHYSRRPTEGQPILALGVWLAGIVSGY